MGKRITSLLLSVVLVLLTVFLLRNEKVVNAADDLVLLENRHPGYWEYLRPEKEEAIPFIHDFYEISVDKILSGNQLDELFSGNVGGVQVSSENGQLIISGETWQDIWLSATQDPIYLDKGTYFVSIGNVLPPSNAYICFEGFDDKTEAILTDIEKYKVLHIDGNYDQYKFTIVIRNNNKVNFRIRPVLYKLSDKDITIDKPVDLEWNNVEKDGISGSDLQFLNNIVNRDSRSINNVVIGCTDGTSYVLKNGELVPIAIDSVGRPNNY